MSNSFRRLMAQAIKTNTYLSRIADAHQQRIWEIELERMSEGVTTSEPNDVWNESIRILNAAKKQLLGY